MAAEKLFKHFLFKITLARQREVLCTSICTSFSLIFNLLASRFSSNRCWPVLQVDFITELLSSQGNFHQILQSRNTTTWVFRSQHFRSFFFFFLLSANIKQKRCTENQHQQIIVIESECSLQAFLKAISGMTAQIPECLSVRRSREWEGQTRHKSAGRWLYITQLEVGQKS